MSQWTDTEQSRLQLNGYELVPGVLAFEQIQQVTAELWRILPSPQEYFWAGPESFKGIRTSPFGGFLEFPFDSLTLNKLAVGEVFLSIAEAVLGTSDLRLFKANIWVKYGSAADYDQLLHVDYPNHTLLVPSSGGWPEQLNMMTYLTDVTLETGPTYVVQGPRASGPPVGATTFDRAAYPRLYDHERPILAAAGSCLTYYTSTIHRGSRIVGTRAVRAILTVGMERAGLSWTGFQSWPRYGKSLAMSEFIQHATPRERSLLGFPPPGHGYWASADLQAIAARYPLMDLAPYSRCGTAGSAESGA